MAAGASKPLEWSRRALDAYRDTLTRIADEDPHSAELVRERVERALALICTHPALGTPGTRRGDYRFPIPRTGHVINYRVTRHAIQIQLWYRARRQVR